MSQYAPLVEEDILSELLDEEDNENIHSSNQPVHARSSCFRHRVVRIPSRYVTLTIVSLPLGAFIFSIFYAFHSDYRSATLVHCDERQVFNYLPSLSAAIGDFSLSRLVWTWCVALHAPGRFYYAQMYYAYLVRIIYRRYHLWVLLAILLNVIEIIGLLGLSFVTSRASLAWHSFFFTIFILSSEMYMVAMCLLLSKFRNIPCIADREIRSQKWKLRLLFVILGCSVVLPYVYHRHNTWCEEGVYTIFAFLEYIVVICNMAFHGTAFWDFYNVMFSVSTRRYLPF